MRGSIPRGNVGSELEDDEAIQRFKTTVAIDAFAIKLSAIRQIS